MAVDFLCGACGETRHALTSEAQFRCPCGGTMARADALRPRREPVSPERRGLEWAAISLGIYLLGGVALVFAALSFARRHGVPLDEGVEPAIRNLAFGQLLFALAIIAGALVLRATDGRIAWFLQAGLGGLVLLRIIDLVASIRTGAGGCLGISSLATAGFAVWLIVKTEQRRNPS